MKILKDFKRYLKINGYPKNTIKNYISRINNLLKEIPYPELNQKRIENFILKLRKTKKANTVNSYILVIDKFMKFIKNPFDKPKMAKKENKLPEYISLEYLEQEIMPMIELEFLDELRIKALLYFMFFTGLRQGEIFRIKRKDIDLNKKIVTVYQPKVSKEKKIPIPKKLTKILETYFEKSEEKENAFNLKKYSINHIMKRLKPFAKGINLHPHIFRSSYCMHLIKKDIPINFVQKLLGHSNIATTMIYAQANFDDIQEEIDKKL
ncbi:hypothetical protein DRN73_07170 [Candidatus Pacearchaeota archaeon]|nr:MAG: hypothetical protein DRN73_07170 [Candidatus Pacearchaeota archaeon]